MKINDYQTSDFCIASTLLTFGGQLVKLDRTNPRRIIFYISIDKDVDKILSDYWDNSLRVSPQDFFDAQKRLKNRMYQGGRYAP